MRVARHGAAVQHPRLSVRSVTITRRPRKTHCTVRSSAEATVKPLPSEILSGDSLQQWNESVTVVAALGMDTQQSEETLRDAFGWGSRKYWKQAKVEVVPQKEDVQGVLDYLRGLGVADADLARMVSTFPQLLACSVPDLLQVNVDRLQKEWRLKGPTLARTLARQPQVLGYAYDCEGTCFGECDRCWARF